MKITFIKLLLLILLLLILLIRNHYEKFTESLYDIKKLRKYRQCKRFRNKVACIKKIYFESEPRFNKPIERLPFIKPINYKVSGNIKHLFPQTKPNRFTH